MGITELVAVFGGIGALIFAFCAWRRAEIQRELQQTEYLELYCETILILSFS